ncbi:PREDICTED: uncharacterized protein LOC105564048 [Vollenhovia emeryi]|uniref:uncharacterized protein LOC105564048 n=1 Tax=Vollenhovia emeryi TaxID=411798 RepID=UPI0005F40D34|nr:PREDICTED: uncharacterized protein LOC105564048 [Vollenhovia emeryi]
MYIVSIIRNKLSTVNRTGVAPDIAANSSRPTQSDVPHRRVTRCDSSRSSRHVNRTREFRHVMQRQRESRPATVLGVDRQEEILAPRTQLRISSGTTRRIVGPRSYSRIDRV